jgi:hypothetical protein
MTPWQELFLRIAARGIADHALILVNCASRRNGILAKAEAGGWSVFSSMISAVLVKRRRCLALFQIECRASQFVERRLAATMAHSALTPWVTLESKEVVPCQARKRRPCLQALLPRA